MFLSSNYADGLEVRIAELAAENADLRRQLATCQADAPKWLRSQNTQLRRAAQAFEAQLSRTEDENADLRRQLATCQEVRLAELALSTQSDALLERAIAEAADLRRQLAECQAAASPALIEEYAKACHYAGERNYAAPDFAVWLRRRL